MLAAHKTQQAVPAHSTSRQRKHILHQANGLAANGTPTLPARHRPRFRKPQPEKLLQSPWTYISVSSRTKLGSAAGAVNKALTVRGRALIAAAASISDAPQVLRVLALALLMLKDNQGQLPVWQPAIVQQPQHGVSTYSTAARRRRHYRQPVHNSQQNDPSNGDANSSEPKQATAGLKQRSVAVVDQRAETVASKPAINLAHPRQERYSRQSGIQVSGQESSHDYSTHHHRTTSHASQQILQLNSKVQIPSSVLSTAGMLPLPGQLGSRSSRHHAGINNRVRPQRLLQLPPPDMDMFSFLSNANQASQQPLIDSLHSGHAAVSVVAAHSQNSSTTLSSQGEPQQPVDSHDQDLQQHPIGSAQEGTSMPSPYITTDRVSQATSGTRQKGKRHRWKLRKQFSLPPRPDPTHKGKRRLLVHVQSVIAGPVSPTCMLRVSNTRQAWQIASAVCNQLLLRRNKPADGWMAVNNRQPSLRQPSSPVLAIDSIGSRAALQTLRGLVFARRRMCLHGRDLAVILLSGKTIAGGRHIRKNRFLVMECELNQPSSLSHQQVVPAAQ